MNKKMSIIFEPSQCCHLFVITLQHSSINIIIFQRFLVIRIQRVIYKKCFTNEKIYICNYFRIKAFDLK